MIGIEKARELLKENCSPIIESLEISVANSGGYVLSENVYSRCDLPQFRQSSVDGYGIQFKDGQLKNEYKIISSVKAGEVAKINPSEDECIRIFTGAMVPETVKIIIMQEDVERSGEKIIINKEINTKINHIRIQGSQNKKGDLSMHAGQHISPAGIAYLQAMGIDKIKVFRKPRVSILIGGDELIQAGEIYQEAKVYESNAFALMAAVEKEGAEVVDIKIAKDSKEEIAEKFSQLLEISDVVLVSGGISVGDYDFVSDVFIEAGVNQIFYKVLQKPGKPLFLGKKGEKIIFGLPGNPASTLCCFYEYVLTALRMKMHKKNFFLPCLYLPLSQSLSKNKNLGVFFKATVNESYTMVKPLEGQESFILSSFAKANALIYVAAGKEQMSAGEIAEVHLLPE